MLRHPSRIIRLILLAASGAVLFQTAAGCDVILQSLQTGLLGVIAGTALYLARNI